MIDYKQKLYKLADIFDLQRQAGLGCTLDILFPWTKCDQSVINWIKSLLPNIDSSYIDFLQNYNGVSIGQWLLLSTNMWDLTIEQMYNASMMLRENTTSSIKDLMIPIALCENQNDFYINHNNDIVCLDTEDFSLPPRKIANSFEEFMNDCVFGRRYLEFNGNDENDEVYDYLKIFYKPYDEETPPA